MDLMDRGGLNALTIRALADELGVGAMSLYTHFRDKDAILAAVADAAIGELEIPEGDGDPLERLEKLARDYYDLLVRHPAMLPVVEAGLASGGPADQRLTEALFALLYEIGLSSYDAVAFVSVMIRFTLGNASAYRARGGREGERYYREHAEARDVETRALLLTMSAKYPAMARLAREYESIDDRQVFEHGLQMLLAQVRSQAGRG